MAQGTIRVGTAGFSYKDWLGNFYPQFCPPADFLRYYGLKFNTVELDSTFYRIPTESMVDKWAAIAPAGFKFAAKFPRTVTHEGELRDRLADTERFVALMQRFGDRLGPLLLQFPHSFGPEEFDTLKALAAAIPNGTQVAVELRHRAWFDETLYTWLRRSGLALCLIDYPGIPRLSERTADWSYVRLVGNRQEITEDFSFVRRDRAPELDWWSDLMAKFAGEAVDVYAYFNNHYSGHAPSTACRLLDVLKEKTRPSQAE